MRVVVPVRVAVARVIVIHVVVIRVVVRGVIVRGVVVGVRVTLPGIVRVRVGRLAVLVRAGLAVLVVVLVCHWHRSTRDSALCSLARGRAGGALGGVNAGDGGRHASASCPWRTWS